MEVSVVVGMHGATDAAHNSAGSNDKSNVGELIYLGKSRQIGREISENFLLSFCSAFVLTNLKVAGQAAFIIIMT